MNRSPSDVNIKYTPTNMKITHPIVYKTIMKAHSLLVELIRLSRSNLEIVATIHMRVVSFVFITCGYIH